MAPRHNRHQPQPAATEGQITGPRSALTSFLRESGITGADVPRFGRNPQTAAAATAAANANAQAGPSGSNSGTATPNNQASTDASSSTASSPGGGSGTVTLSVVTGSSGGTKRKAGGAGTSAAALKKKKKEEQDDFELGGKPLVAKPAKYENRTPGAISVCADCGKRFTVTKYTPHNPLGAGLLCSKCTSEGIEDIAAGAFKKPAAAKAKLKKKAVKVVEDHHTRVVKPLLQSVLEVIGKQIENVDALGDIGSKNLDRIAKIVCKARALSGSNLHLFLDAAHTELRLYDCTSLKEHELSSIAVFCPRLERLSLNLCGMLDDDVLEKWGKGFPQLKYLSLYAPYLATNTAWKTYLETFGGDHQLEGFGIRLSVRFDDDCIRTLVERNPGLYNLQLSELSQLNNDSLQLLYPLKQLTTLDISKAGAQQDTGNVLTDESVVALLEHVGENLVELVLDQNYLLTDRVLLEGVKVHCPRLKLLSLHSLSKIESVGFESLFTEWVNPGLTHLVLHRCLRLENEAILAVVAHSGHSLKLLDLNSVDEVEEHVLKKVAEGCSEVEELDLSFVRSTDDFVVKAVLEGMKGLKKLFVHGDNRVTGECPQRKGCSIRGLENSLHVEL